MTPEQQVRAAVTGLKVVWEKDWNSPSIAGKGTWAPAFVMLHHTAGTNSLGVLKSTAWKPVRGSHFLVARDGTVHVLASVKAYHAGKGGPRFGISAGMMNGYAWGIEIEDLGKAQTMTPAQIDATAALSAGLLKAMGKDTAALVQHKEWNPTGKVDTRYATSFWRQKVQAKMTPPVKPPAAAKPPAVLTQLAVEKPTKGDTFNRGGWPDPRKWVAYDKHNGNETYGHTDPNACHKYSADAVTVDGRDALTITATRIKAGDKWWRSGFLSSRDAKCFYPLYGTIKVHATLPVAPGIWPAIWLRARNGGATRAEVDIAEVFARPGAVDTVSQHLHFPSTTGKAMLGKGMKLPVGVPHTYWVRITPDGTGIKFTLGVNDKTAGTYRHPDRAAIEKGTDVAAFWDIALNVAVSSGKWTGSTDGTPPTPSPQIMRVDWVEWSA